MSKHRYKNNDDIYVTLYELKNELDLSKSLLKEQRNDIKALLLLLIENDIPIPENLINKYINKVHKIKQNVKLPF